MTDRAKRPVAAVGDEPLSPVGGSPIDAAIAETGYELQPRRLVFKGRNGRGFEVRVYEVGDWLDVWHIDGHGDARAFSLNSHYTAQLAEALVGVLAMRTTR